MMCMLTYPDAAKSIDLRLLLNPLRVESSQEDNTHVGQVIFERTRLEGEPGKQRAIGTGETENIPADLVITSVGYKGESLDGMDETMFDNQRGVIANNHGKVEGDNNIFATGWIKRGPSGIIGTNISDAKDTVSCIMKYVIDKCHGNQSGASGSLKGRSRLFHHLGSIGVKPVAWNQFLKIDEVERDRNRLRNDVQPREKILSVEEMLSCFK